MTKAPLCSGAFAQAFRFVRAVAIGPLRSNAGPACRRASLRQRVGLYGAGYEAVRSGAQFGAMLHASSKPQSNGMSEAFVKNVKRDYISISAIPLAETALQLIHVWIEDYNEIHSHSALKMVSPR